MKPDHTHDFIQTNWKELHRFTLAAAYSRFRKFGLDRSRVVNSQDPKDIVSRVMLKICTPPYELTPDDLTLDRFKKKLGNLVSTEVSKLIRNRKGKRTEVRDPAENMSDDQFFEWIMDVEKSDAEQLESHRQMEEQIDLVNNLLLKYEETDPEAYFVLDGWAHGKSIEETSFDNGITSSDVMNARKRIRRALRLARQTTPT